MKRCLKCSTLFDRAEWKCPQCGWAPLQRNGRVHFAPEISGANESYDPAWYPELASLEAGNFWFRARNRAFSWIAHRYLPQTANYLEIGCGTGYVLQMFRREFPGWKLTATEAHAEGLDFAANRVEGPVTFYQVDARAIPFREEFDVVGAFDVIEHIKEDEAVLAEIHAALKPRGYVFLSVPQHMFLWSQYDELGHHFRRYSKVELDEKVRRAGFTVVDSTSFNSLLLPVMLASRWIRNEKEKTDVLDELRLGRTLNRMLEGVLGVERAALRAGVRWPVGGSRIVLAQRS
jgi:SAM-dependent methyltransferase